MKWRSHGERETREGMRRRVHGIARYELFERSKFIESILDRFAADVVFQTFFGSDAAKVTIELTEGGNILLDIGDCCEIKWPLFDAIEKEVLYWEEDGQPYTTAEKASDISSRFRDWADRIDAQCEVTEDAAKRADNLEGTK
jgi:hypothetical protein